MSSNYPSPIVGTSTSNVSDSFAIGTGSLWYLAATDATKADETLAVAYGFNGPAEGAVCLGLLKENVNFSYEMVIEEISSGTPLTVKKRLIKSVKANITVGLAELTISSLELFMPPLSNFIVSNHWKGELPIGTYSFVNVKPHTGGGVVINFPYATISGRVSMDFGETSLMVTKLEVVAVGDTAPSVAIS